MIRFNCDYLEGAHPKILEKMMETNFVQTPGYGEDEYCERAMVTQYGMSDKFGLMGLATQQDQYLTGRLVMNCGDATAAGVDDEVMRILKESYAEAKRLLLENRDVMDEIAAFLIEKETITGKEFMEIFRKCKGMPESDEQEKEAVQDARVKMNKESQSDTSSESEIMTNEEHE